MVLNSQVSGKNTRFVLTLTGAGAVGRGGTVPLTAAGIGASCKTSSPLPVPDGKTKQQH